MMDGNFSHSNMSGHVHEVHEMTTDHALGHPSIFTSDMNVLLLFDGLQTSGAGQYWFSLVVIFLLVFINEYATKNYVAVSTSVDTSLLR
jgi:hypothetical protein